jgi:RNA polymerase sigma factor (TIGR02999 family)
VTSSASSNPALDLLVETFYVDLRAMARSIRRRVPRAGETFATTALVHEAWLKLARRPEFRDHGHFLATAAVAMRHVLVSDARARLAIKRGEAPPTVPLEDAEGLLSGDDSRTLAIDGALAALEGVDPRAARVVECRFFAGLTETETAMALGVTERTVQRDWVKAKALLYDALAED